MASRATIPSESAEGDGAVEGDLLEASEPIRPPDTGIPATITVSTNRLLWQARAGLGFGILCLAIALAVFLQGSGLRADAARRAEVLNAGEVIALRVTTFDGVTIDDWVTQTQALATGSYADEVAQLFDPEIRQSLADAEVESVGEVLNSFVQEITGDDAIVFAVLRQSYTSSLQPQVISDELRMEIELTLVDDQWLATDVAVLGPSTITPIDPGAASQ